jgi:hypothetical protein
MWWEEQTELYWEQIYSLSALTTCYRIYFKKKLNLILHQIEFVILIIYITYISTSDLGNLYPASYIASMFVNVFIISIFNCCFVCF